MALVLLNGQNTMPTSPSVTKGIKNNSLIQAISKRFTRRSREDLKEDELRTSSTDSSLSNSSSTSHNSRSRQMKTNATSCNENCLRIPSSQNFTSSTVDITKEGMNIKNKHYYTTSADNIIKVFENLAISTRSKSCGGIEKDKKKSKKSKKPPPKRILRSPVKYVYVKGWSGLPTQRIPVPRTYASYPGGRRMQYIEGLNR